MWLNIFPVVQMSTCPMMMVGLLAPITGPKLSPMGGVFWVWILPSKWRSRPSCWKENKSHNDIDLF